MSFNHAFVKLIIIEQGYVNNPADKGGETYKGVSRKFHPGWVGWGIIDELKPHRLFPGILEIDKNLQRFVRSFYEVEFWGKVKGDDLVEIFPEIAYELFDTAVNLGPSQAIKYLQRALNVLNTRSSTLLYPDLTVDGIIGNITVSAVRHCSNSGRSHALLVYANTLQGYHYITRAEEDKSQEVFAAGWSKRISFNSLARGSDG